MFGLKHIITTSFNYAKMKYTDIAFDVGGNLKKDFLQMYESNVGKEELHDD